MAISERERCTDRWPAWLVAIYVCITIGLHNGILNCGALFYPALMDTLGHPISVVSWLVTGQYAMTYCLSPLYNRLIDFVPNRIAIILAVFLTSGSLIGSAMVSNFWAFLVLYTIVGGLGMGISVVRAMAIAADYFDRYRILALAICSSGSGLGTLIYSKIGAHMIDTYTWRVALIGYALLHLHAIVFGLLLKPLPAEPVPEPTVLIPDQPDLNACDLSPDALDRKNELGPSLFLSILSVNSVQGNPSVVRQQRRNSVRTVTSDLRVIIEFVKATRVSGPYPLVYLDPVTFLPDPGPRVIRQLEDAAQEALFGDSPSSTNQLMIPIIFVVSNFEVIQVDAQEPMTGSQLRFFLDSRADISGTTEQPEDSNLSASQYRIPVGDSFASSVAAMQDRRQIRQSIRAVLKKGQFKVTEVAEQLANRGLPVYPTPIIALVDQGGLVGKAKISIGPGDDQTHVWGNLGIENYAIPEEVEPTDQLVDEIDGTIKTGTEQAMQVDRSANTDKNRLKLARKSLVHTSQIFSSIQSIGMGLPRQVRSTSRAFDSVLIQSSSDFSKSRNQARDLFASVTSIKTPHEAVSLLATKYQDELKVADAITEDATMEKRKSQKLLLLDLFFLTFLLTRTLVFITDSIVFAHLTNFAISCGFDPEASAGLLSFIGTANMLGRLGTGLIGQFARGLELRGLTAGCLLILAVHTVLMPLYPTYISLAIYAVSYGILVSPSFAFAPSIAYELVGPSRYDQAVAFVYQFEASGFLVGGPIGGMIKEINNKYFECFAFGGTNIMVAAVILFVQGIIRSGLLAKLSRLVRHGTGKLTN